MTSPPPLPRRYRFGEFTLSPRRRSLTRRGREVPLIPRYLDLLLLLVDRRAEALSRQEIFDRVWADVVVSDGALTQAVRTLRRTLGEDGTGGVFIRTVSRHGYQFVCPVVEEDDIADTDGTSRPGPATESGAAPSTPPGADDPLARSLACLLSEESSEDERREASEELHQLGTAEALRRLGPGHAVAWAHLRDSRWEVAGAGPVPLLGHSVGPSAWLALAGLRLRRVRRLVGSRWASASAGGALAGLVAGLVGGVLMALPDGGAPPSASLLLGLGLVGAAVAAIGAAGVGSGLAAAEALVRSWRTSALVVLGSVGGATVAAGAHRLVDALVEAVFGFSAPAVGGGIEGLVIGAAAGFGYGLSTRRPAGGMAAPRGAARLRVCVVTGLACATAAGLLGAGGLRLGATSLRAVVAGFPTSQVRLDALGHLVGELSFGPRTRSALSAAEGLLFGAGLAGGLTRRPRNRPRRDE